MKAMNFESHSWRRSAEPETGETLVVDDPVTNEPYSDVAAGRAADVDRAVDVVADGVTRLRRFPT